MTTKRGGFLFRPLAVPKRWSSSASRDCTSWSRRSARLRSGADDGSRPRRSPSHEQGKRQPALSYLDAREHHRGPAVRLALRALVPGRSCQSCSSAVLRRCRDEGNCHSIAGLESPERRLAASLDRRRHSQADQSVADAEGRENVMDDRPFSQKLPADLEALISGVDEKPIRRRNDGPPSGDDLDLLPSPSVPMAVARAFIENRIFDGGPTLRHWRGGRWEWQQTHLAES